MRIGAIAVGKKRPEDINVIVEVPIGDEPVGPCPRPSSQSTTSMCRIIPTGLVSRWSESGIFRALRGPRAAQEGEDERPG